MKHYAAAALALLIAADSTPKARGLVPSLVGTGLCVDSGGNSFSTMTALLNKTSVSDDCHRWCLQNPLPELVGFTFDVRGSAAEDHDCFCHFGGGRLPSPLPSYTNPTSTVQFSDTGVGSVAGVKYNAGAPLQQCFELSRHTKVGDGFCADSGGNYYSHVAGTLPVTGTPTDCSHWCSQNPLPQLLGFYFQPNVVDALCWCYFDGGLPSPVPVYNPRAAGSSHYNGTGPIVNTIGSSGECHKFDVRNAPVTQFPTKAPTKVPTMAPSKAPTKSPSNDLTNAPSKVPTKAPSKVPTKAPSKVPTKAPVAPSPPVTKAPISGPGPVTKAPVSSPGPGPSPVTPSPVPGTGSKSNKGTKTSSKTGKTKRG